MSNPAYTKAYRTNMNPTDAQIEQWEKEHEARESNRDHGPDFDYENAILIEQENDESWWG